MAAVPLAPGVWRLPTAPADLINSFLLDDGQGRLTLVDAGLRRASRRIVAALEGLGRRPQDIARVVLTHAHSDHAGGLAATVAATGAAVQAHDRDASFLRDGRSPQLDPATRAGRLLSRRPSRFPPVVVASTFADGELLPGGLRVVHTPGHTPGHVSLLHEPTGVLVTGDAIFNVRGLRYAPRMSCTDIRLSRETADRLADLEYEVAGFTHGAHISTGAREAVRAFLRGRPR